MELFCCMNGRRNRAASGNPLEGRANLRLQGKQDFSDSSPPEFDQESPLVVESNRPHFSGGSPVKSSSKQYLEVPRRGSNGLPGAFQTGHSAGSKDDGERKQEKKVSFDATEDSSDAADFSQDVSEPEKVVPSPPSHNDQDKEVHRPSSSKPETKVSASKLAPPDSPESSAALREQLRREVQEYAKKLRKTASKYPSGTKEGSTSGWFAPKLKERFFDIVVVDPSDRGKSDKATRLGWWENEEESKNEEPLGDIPISSITEVVQKQDVEKGLQVKIVTNQKDKKGDNVTLLMRFATAKEAESWSKTLKTFQVCFKRWSAQFSEEDRSRENSAMPHMSMCTTGSTFTAQATNSSSGSKPGRSR